MAYKRQPNAHPMDDFEDRYIVPKSKKKALPKPPKGKLPMKGEMGGMLVRPKKKPKKGKK